MKIIRDNPLIDFFENFEYANEPENNRPINNFSDESENDSNDESENDSRDEFKYISSFNAATLEDIKQTLYELHEYFDEFKIEVVACPNLTREPYNLKFNDMCGKMNIEEIYNRKYNADVIEIDFETDVMEFFTIHSGRNYFFNEQKAGMVLKMRAKGRKTNYNIITLIQNILHKRFWYKIGLSGVLMIEGGVIRKGQFIYNFDQLICYDVDCNLSKQEISIGAIVNDPVKIINHHGELFYTSDRYLFHFNSQFNDTNRFVNDISPKETEYTGYFNIAEQVIHI